MCQYWNSYSAILIEMIHPSFQGRILASCLQAVCELQVGMSHANTRIDVFQIVNVDYEKYTKTRLVTPNIT